MENIKDEQYLKKINARLEEIHSKVKSHFKDFDSATQWRSSKRKIVDTEVNKLIELVKKCTGENILANVSSIFRFIDPRQC